MKESMSLKRIIAQYLRNVANKLDHDECELSEQEQDMLLSQIAHISITKSEAADLLGMSVRNFDRKVKSGILPAGKKDIGNKLLHWYKDEILKCQLLILQKTYN